jgi:pimeloyl-ACP methyl ester carboxylesterase
VTSRDGTEIAWWTSGDGPPLLLVHGAMADHTRWRPLQPHLEPYATVHAMDRRGRGASGDGLAYAIAREFEDVAAVVDAIAAASGSGVDVMGNSFGATCAAGAATLTANVRRLVLYEPVVRAENALPPDVARRFDDLLARGEHEAIAETLLRVVGLDDDDVAAFMAQPSWPGRVATAHTVPREVRAESSWTLHPALAATITAPTLLPTGGDSPAVLTADVDYLAAALPDARVVVIEDQEHLADVLAPEVFASHVLAFLRAAP